MREPSLVLSLPSVPPTLRAGHKSAEDDMEDDMQMDKCRGEHKSAEDDMEVDECTDETRPHALSARTRAREAGPAAAEEVEGIKCTDEPPAPRTQTLSSVLSRFSQVRGAWGAASEEGRWEREALPEYACVHVYISISISIYLSIYI